MADTQRNIILHCHITKNAGTTFDWVLKRNFKKDGFLKKDLKKTHIFPPQELEALLMQDSNLKVFTTEQMSLPHMIDYDYKNFKLLPIAFLRNPVDRVASLYNQLRKPHEPTPTSKAAKESTLKEFVEYAIAHNNATKHVTNGQTWILSGLTGSLTKARATVDKCLFVGIVERPIESYVVLEEKLKPYFPDIDLAYVRRNVSSQRKDEGVKKRLEKMKQEIGDKLFEDLNARNKNDFELRRYAVAKLENELGNIPDLDAKLRNFEKRNRELETRRTKLSRLKAATKSLISSY